MTHRGTIVFMLTNIGSKSEGIKPFLYKGKGEFLDIWIPEDDSHLGNMIAKYDGQQVTLHGKFNEYNIFLIDIVESANPAQTTPSTETIEEAEPVDSKNKTTTEE